MEPEGSLPGQREPITGPCADPHEVGPYTRIQFPTDMFYYNPSSYA